MQERARVSSMDLKAHMNNLRKNPKFTEEILKLVESDLQYGLTIEETEMMRIAESLAPGSSPEERKGKE